MNRVTAGGLGGLAESYSYDELGNRTASHISVGHLVNENNQLLSDDQFTYVYDLNGNLVSKTDTAALQTTTYNWNAQNQLTSIDFHDLTTATYAYDALGRRIEKDVDGAVTAYVYDGEDIALEFDDLGALLARYSHGQSTDQPLAMERGGQTYYYHADHLGSVRLVTDSAGAVINRYDYDAYGNFEIRSEGVTSPYTFTGREFDAESGLFYYRARYYDANSGRFISEDPLGFNAGDPNLYRYVLNNPVNLNDPSGLGHGLTTPYAPPAPFYFPKGGIELNPDALRAIEKTGEQLNSALRAVLKTVIAICLAPGTPGFSGDAWDIAESILTHAENGSDAADESPNDDALEDDKRNNADQDAAIQLAKEARRKKGISEDEAEALVELGNDVGVPSRGPESHTRRKNKDFHIHVGPVDHIKVK